MITMSIIVITVFASIAAMDNELLKNKLEICEHSKNGVRAKSGIRKTVF
jgi:hypothetical protein